MPFDTHIARADLYAGAHKGLRLFMADTLAWLGRVDVDDAADLQRCVDQLLQLLQLYAEHTRVENEHLHAALEARRPGASARLGLEHADQAAMLAELHEDAQALLARPQAAAALRLYRRFSRFVAACFEHMLTEESRHNAALCELHDDAELLALQQRLQAALPPARRQLLLRWMLPALTPVERAALGDA